MPSYSRISGSLQLSPASFSWIIACTWFMERRWISKSSRLWRSAQCWSETSRTSAQRNLIVNAGESAVLTSESRSYLVRIDGKTSHKKVVNKRDKSPIVRFEERVLAVTTPISEGADSGFTSKIIWFVARQRCWHRYTIQWSDSQVVREDQLNVIE